MLPFRSLLNRVLLGVIYLISRAATRVLLLTAELLCFLKLQVMQGKEGRLIWHQSGPVTFDKKSTSFFDKKNRSWSPQNESKIIRSMKMYLFKGCFLSF